MYAGNDGNNSDNILKKIKFQCVLYLSFLGSAIILTIMSMIDNAVGVRLDTDRLVLEALWQEVLE